MPERVRYEVDPYNRLVIIDDGLALPKQRRVIDGVFEIGNDSFLQYRVKSPSDPSDNLPYQLKLYGSWSLTKGHDLRFTFDKSDGGMSGDSLTISGDVIDLKHDSILFSVTTKRDEGVFSTYVMTIYGRWQVGDNNLLSFKIERTGGLSDDLIFEAGWEVGKNNEIIYRYEKKGLKRGDKISHCLTIEGRWYIGRKGVITYQIDDADSQLSFETSAGICGDNYIKYEIGVKSSELVRPAKRVITLFGAWRIKRGSGLFFDVECGDGSIYSISFTAEARLTANDMISFKLVDDIGKGDLGMTVELDRAILKGDGSAFVRLLGAQDELSITIGAGIDW